MKVSRVSCPEGSLLQGAFAQVDYLDAFRIVFTSERELSIEEVAKLSFRTSPLWVRWLFDLRNRAVRLMGLKTPESTEKRLAEDEYRADVGQSVGMFRVFEKNESEVIFGTDDKHLDFRVSNLLKGGEGEYSLTLTTSVSYKNAMGRLYFFFVKPFHRMIVPSYLKSLVKRLVL